MNIQRAKLCCFRFIIFMQEQYRQLQEATKRQAIAMFMEITQIEDEHEAEYHLNASHYDVEAATHSYLEDPGKALREMKQAEHSRRLKQLMRVSKKGDKDHLWRPVLNGDPVRFSLNPPPVKVPGGNEYYNSVGKDFFPKLNLEASSLEEAIKKSISSHKPLCIFVYGGQLITYFQEEIFTENVVEYLNKNFVNMGLVKSSVDFERLSAFAKPRMNSFFVILRVNMFDEIILINEFDVEAKKTTAENVMAVLRNALKSQEDDRKEEVEAIKVFEQTQGPARMKQYETYNDEDHEEHEGFQDHHEDHGGEAEKIDLEQMRIMREIQEREFEESQAAHIRKKSEQLLQEQQQKLEQQAIQKANEERQVRKMSMPDEPSQGQGIMQIAFRTPSGSRVKRNFEKDDTVEFLFSFVELCDDIWVENEVHRHFDILTIAPSKSLENRKQQKLKVVFEDSDQETLIVKQVAKQT